MIRWAHHIPSLGISQWRNPCFLRRSTPAVPIRRRPYPSTVTRPVTMAFSLLSPSRTVDVRGARLSAASQVFPGIRPFVLARPIHLALASWTSAASSHSAFCTAGPWALRRGPWHPARRCERLRYLSIQTNESIPYIGIRVPGAKAQPLASRTSASLLYCPGG